MKIRIKLGKAKPYSDAEPQLFLGYATYPGSVSWQAAELQQWDEHKGDWVPIEIIANE
jgi:hypothetical protein